MVAEGSRDLSKSTPNTANTGHPRLVFGVQVFTAITALVAAATLGYATHEGRTPLVLAGCAIAICAVVGGAILCSHTIVASHVKSYRHGYLDGWVRGRLKQEPDPRAPSMHS